ncbi:HD domain-containing phosphohydrolase [uncultured Selenomonas sp.]|uniref:HD-GYP domain-containing protein n=1 Tax=uncultured Selenomonas sp. TaxID=159275 RepID=UPI0028D49C8E|nr:HD domain-containing phosphohydrolase [uncultured Selenomonas sp.]
MILARTIVNAKRVVVVSENTELTQAHITRLKFLKIPVVYIKDETELREERSPIFSRSNLFIKQYEDVVGTAQSIFDEAKKTGHVPVAETKEMVQADLLPLSRRSGTIDYLNEINHLASDIYNHSLRVSILAGAFAKWMKLDREMAKDIVMAGFLHDVGKSKFDPRLLEKNIETLEGEDYERYIQHTVDGAQILNNVAGLTEGVRLAALQHHERMDGSGFPFNIQGEDIHLYARIIAVADLYDNITIEREGYPRRTPFDAVAEIARQMYTGLDPQVCMPVLTNIKNAFLGSRVLLSNHREGTITAYPHGVVPLPIVTLSDDEVIDLNEEKKITIMEYNPK